MGKLGKSRGRKAEGKPSERECLRLLRSVVERIAMIPAGDYDTSVLNASPH